MADKLDPIVEITLNDNKPRRLKFGLRALYDFEKETGHSLFDLDWLKGLSIEDLPAVIWAGLRWENKELTVDQVIDLIDLKNIKELMPAVFAALRAALPEAKKEAPLAQTSQSPLIG